jgi:ketosteroid isomerase-like protein
MSQANVERVTRLVDAFNRRNIDAIAELTTADFEWFPAMPGTAVGASFIGRDGLERYLADLSDTWAEYRSVDLEFREVGERVLALGRSRCL